jgi:DNA-binding response OmpR family regulator
MSPRERRVLCAEPHADTCGLITMLLEQQGHEVVAAKSIGECLALVSDARFDLYMLDDDYIDGTGLELCKQLRRLTPDTPILFFSSRAFQRDRERGIEAGASAYLTKPGDIFEIVQTVNSILLPRREAGRDGRKNV